jgi:F-type H+-transporting ATPase subunit b
MHIEISQVITQIISFLVVLWILRRYAWQPLLTAMDERQRGIQGEFDAIAAQKNANAELKASYELQLADLNNQAQLILKDAQDRGRELLSKIEEEAQQSAKQMITTAQETLQSEILKAKQLLKEEVVQMVVAATAKVVAKNADQQMQNHLVQELINQEGKP